MAQSTGPVIAKLHVTQPKCKKETLELRAGQEIKLGRGEICEVVLNDSSASRLHASVSATVNGVVVADLASRNGTFVNEERIGALHQVQPGDIIDVGNTKLEVELLMPEGTAAPVPAQTLRATVDLERIPAVVLVATVRDLAGKLEKIPAQDLNRMLIRWASKSQKAIESFAVSLTAMRELFPSERSKNMLQKP